MWATAGRMEWIRDPLLVPHKFRPSKFGNEVQVRQVSGALHHTKGLPDFSSGLEKRVEVVKNMLEKGTSPATVLGIVGVGGIGKTTLAKRLFNETSVEFEYTCFLDNVKGIPIHNLTDCLLTQFHRDGVKVQQIQWSDLKDKKTLIVMDDVDSAAQLRKLPELHDFGGDSHVIITSRNRNVFDVFSKNLLYDVGFFNDDEAKELLCQHAFGLDKIPKYLLKKDHRLRGCVYGLVQICRGLPLTLEVLGRCLRQHNDDVEFWDDTIGKLRHANPLDGSQYDSVWASLKVCYDDLAREEKEMYIEAGTVFFKQPLEEALAAWSGSYACVELTWKNLIIRSLVKVIDGEIWVHEQLRDLVWIESELCKATIDDFNTFTRSGSRAAILMRYKKERGGKEVDFVRRRLDVWVEAGVTKMEDRRGIDLEVTRIEPLLNYKGFTSTVQLESLEHMENLKYLDLGDLAPEGLSKNFPRNLSLLKWTLPAELGRPELPGISWKGVRKLGVLELEGWKVQTEFLDALGHLTNLRILRLRSLEGLDVLPEEFGNLSCLQQLKLNDLSLSTLPDSLGDLGALEYLDISELRILQLPGSFGGLRSLIRLEIWYCTDLGSLPESFGHLSSLKELAIHRCDSLEILPGSFGLLASLEDLEIVSCFKLKRLPDNFGELKSLKKLKIDGASNLEVLSNSFGNLSSLKHLKLLNCPNLEELPASFGKLSFLEELTLKGCSRFQRLPDNFGELKSLKKLEIDEASNLWAPSNSFGNLSSLTHLKLLNCPNLEELPASLGTLSFLEELPVTGCSRLQRLPDNTIGTDFVYTQQSNPVSDGVPERFPPHLPEGHSPSHLDGIGGRGVPDQKDVEESLTTFTTSDATSITTNTKVDCETRSLVETPQRSVRDGKGSKLLEVFLTEVSNSGGDGYILSKKWLLTLDEHEREELFLVLGRNGYLEIFETLTTVFFERTEEHVQFLSMYDDPSRAPENNDLCLRDENKVEPLDDGVTTSKIEQTRFSARKRDGDLFNSSKGTLSLDNKTQLLTGSMSEISPSDAPSSLLEKGEMPLTYPTEILKFLKTAVNDSSLYNYAVSTHWLSTLNDHQLEDVKSALSEAGYSEIYKTSTTTYFERIQGRIKNCPTYETDTVGTSGRNDIGGDTESSGSFQGHGNSLADNHGSDVGGRDSLAVMVAVSSKTFTKCECPPQCLTVSIFDLNFIPPSQSPIELSTSSSQGAYVFNPSSRQRVANCSVTFPKNRKGYVISTEVDKDISMTTVTFTTADGYVPSVENVSVNVSAGTSLTCCLRSDHDNKKVYIKFSTIRGEAKLGEPVDLEKALSLGSVRALMCMLVSLIVKEWKISKK